MQTIVRELSKMCMVVLAFALPIYLANHFSSAWYLLLFILSFVFVLFIFLHYEDLEESDKASMEDDE